MNRVPAWIAGGKSSWNAKALFSICQASSSADVPINQCHKQIGNLSASRNYNFFILFIFRPADSSLVKQLAQKVDKLNLIYIIRYWFSPLSRLWTQIAASCLPFEHPGGKFCGQICRFWANIPHRRLSKLFHEQGTFRQATTMENGCWLCHLRNAPSITYNSGNVG